MTADIKAILDLGRKRVEDDPTLIAFHKLVPIETPILWDNGKGFLSRGIVVGGKQIVRYGDGGQSWDLPRLNVLLDGAEHITHLPENELEYYMSGEWRNYKEVMRQVLK